jgi:uncharacterized protein (TIGR00269 family)
VTHLDYAGRHLCGDHFQRLVKRRFKQDLREQLDAAGFGDGARIAVGLSGGKDSSTLTALLVDALGPDPRFEIVPVSVDEGIPGYRDAALASARELADQLDLELRVVSHEGDHGWTTQEVAETNPERKPCATCGVFRRTSLNRAAREEGCDVLAVGHNLDDAAETTLMNLLRADLDQVLRTGPHEEAPEGLIPRIKPLRSSTEQEVALYGILEDLPYHGAECPHAANATRRTYRSLLLDLVDQEPSARHRLLSLEDKLKQRLDAEAGDELDECPSCGEPTAGGTCRACQLVDELEQRTST